MIVEPDLPDHPKTWKLARRLGITKDAAVVLLIRIWGHCQARRDDFLGADADDVAACARWEGKPKPLLEALCAASLVDSAPDRTPPGYIAHGWRDRNCGWLKKVEGGRIRQEKAHRASNGQLAATSAQGKQPAKLTPSLQHAGSKAGGVERSGEENHHVSRAQARESVVSSTTEILCRIFGRKKYLGHEATVALGNQADAGVIPLTPEDAATLERFYFERKNAAPADARMWRTSADAIAKELPAEIEKARAYLTRNSIVISTAEKEAAAVPEPPGWPSWFSAQYPETARPESFFELPASLRSEFGVWLSRNPELLP